MFRHFILLPFVLFCFFMSTTAIKTEETIRLCGAELPPLIWESCENADGSLNCASFNVTYANTDWQLEYGKPSSIPLATEACCKNRCSLSERNLICCYSKMINYYGPPDVRRRFMHNFDNLHELVNSLEETVQEMGEHESE